MSTKFEYAIESVIITSSSGREYEIKDLIGSVDFYESINSPYIKCELSVVDAAGMIETIPVIGQEKVKLIIKDQNTNTTIKRDFFVASVQDYVKGNTSSSIYILKLVTPEYMLNSLGLVSHAYTGPISVSVEKIVKNYLNSEIKTLERSIGDYRVVVPNWNPYKAIDWLTRRAISPKNYPFVFYETLKDGLTFESYETIVGKKVFNKYVSRDNTAVKDDADNKAAMMNAALQYSIEELSNTGKNILRGAFGQGMHVVDHANRSYKFVRYNYDDDFKKKNRLDEAPFINDSFRVNNKKISEYDSIHTIAYKNPLAYDVTNLNNYNNNVEFTKLEVDPFVFQSGLIKINMTIKGRTDISVGKVIEFEVPKNSPVVHNTNRVSNEYLSGKFIVQNIHHKMEEGKYYIVMDVIKESLGKKVK